MQKFKMICPHCQQRLQKIQLGQKIFLCPHCRQKVVYKMSIVRLAIGASIGFFIGALLNELSLLPAEFSTLGNIAFGVIGYLLAFNGRVEKA